MKRYQARNGLVLTQVCGEYLLVAARALRESISLDPACGNEIPSTKGVLL